MTESTNTIPRMKTRYREEIRHGADPAGARRVALRTSGLAVTFSGITVIAALAGERVAPNTRPARRRWLAAFMVILRWVGLDGL